MTSGKCSRLEKSSGNPVSTDDDGPLLRAKNAAAQTALNAQLRADENRLQQRQDDGLARVLKLIAEEEARMRGTIIDDSPIRRDQSES